MYVHRRVVLLLLVPLAIGTPRFAVASNIFEGIGTLSSAPILEMDPSVRSASMGSAGTADVWDVAPNSWANPTLLGKEPGFARYLDVGFGYREKASRGRVLELG